MKQNNALIGARVVVDHANRWKGCRAEIRDAYRRETENGNSDFGLTGTIVSYDPKAESGKQYEICFDGKYHDTKKEGIELLASVSKGSVDTYHRSWFTVLELHHAERDVMHLLEQIHATLRNIDQNTLRTLGQLKVS